MTRWKIPPKRHRSRKEARRVPYFVADACLRCQRLFGSRERCLIVAPPEGLQVGLTICEHCDQGRALDRVRFTTIYLPPPAPVVRTWPSLHGHRNQVQGYAKQMRLSNGIYTVGLCRGHVEVWSAEDRQRIPVGLVEHALGHQHHGEAVVSLFFGGQACGHHWALHFIQRQQHIVVQLDPLMGEEEEDA